ncbi:MAG: putative dehydrogenase/nucleoside-diphosphate-sugar epimerase [Planctomycetota bacterium]|jgi:predicted dehydrogenase/nucleoside-diphosphate-sugar epimerase
MKIETQATKAASSSESPLTNAVSSTPQPESPAFELISKKPTRVALVGAGFIADFHLEILTKMQEVEVVAVCDPVLGRARSLADKWSVPVAVASIAELAEHGIQIAHLLTPPDLHMRLAKEVLELGIGLYVEKPLVLSASDARELVELAAKRKLPLGVNHNHVFQPAFVRLMEKVNAGEIGAVEHVQVTWSVPLMQLDAEQYSHWMFRSPRNIMFEQGPHPLSQVHRLVGAVQDCHTEILSSRELLPGQTFVDRWLVSARGERATAEIYLAFGQGFTRNTIQVIGSDGTLEADFTHDTLAGERKTLWLEFWNSFLAAWRRGKMYKKDARRVLKNYLSATLGLAERKDAFFAGMRSSIGSFHQSLRAGTALPVDGAQAAEVLDWCDAVAKEVKDVEAPNSELSAESARPGEVVVLGGTGFIGKRVVRGLLDAGVPVTCVVRRTHSLPEIVEEGARDGRIRLLRGSLEKAEDLEALFDGAHAVVHLATGSGDTWDDVERVMVQGSVKVAEACLRKDIKRFVYISSVASLYTGDEGASPLADAPSTDPEAATRSVYSRGKAATEDALFELAKEHQLPLIVLRPGIVVGDGTPMQHSGYGLWARDNHCVGWGLGEHPLPLVWVQDVADAIVSATLHKENNLHGKALNLCSKVQLNAREVVEELRHVTGRDLHFHARALPRSQAMEIGKYFVKLAGGRAGLEWPDYRDLRARGLFTVFESNLAREVLGWTPVEDREEFLDKTVRIYGKKAQ